MIAELPGGSDPGSPFPTITCDLDLGSHRFASDASRQALRPGSLSVTEMIPGLDDRRERRGRCRNLLEKPPVRTRMLALAQGWFKSFACYSTLET